LAAAGSRRWAAARLALTCLTQTPTSAGPAGRRCPAHRRCRRARRHLTRPCHRPAPTLVATGASQMAPFSSSLKAEMRRLSSVAAVSTRLPQRPASGPRRIKPRLRQARLRPLSCVGCESPSSCNMHPCTCYRPCPQTLQQPGGSGSSIPSPAGGLRAAGLSFDGLPGLDPGLCLGYARPRTPPSSAAAGLQRCQRRPGRQRRGARSWGAAGRAGRRCRGAPGALPRAPLCRGCACFFNEKSRPLRDVFSRAVCLSVRCACAFLTLRTLLYT
jgi:hypothetical protein